MAIAPAVAGLLLFAGTAAAAVDFSHDVVPILRKHCVACHGGKEAKGGFSLNTRQLVLESEALVPGKAGESRLIELVTSTNADEQMPPKDRPRLSPKEIATLRAWIDQGAGWEAGFTFSGDVYEPPLKPRRPELPRPTEGRSHPVDRIIDAYLQEYELPLPESVPDRMFLRRASLDLTGLLPTPELLEEFLADERPDRRERLIDRLLADDVARAEHWLTFWNDLLRNDYAGTGFITGGRRQISGWLYRALLENRPYDAMVRELIAPSSNATDGFLNGIRWRGTVSASQQPEVQFAQNAGQVFLGINLKCASCHDSFIDRWTLAETWGIAQIAADRPLEMHRCDKPVGQQATAKWLFPELGQITADAPRQQRLEELARLMTHPENGRFTRTVVNRLWQRLMGRGIVHPVDAMQTEPWNADLLDWLAVDLAEHDYDLNHTIRRICTSEAYQARTHQPEAEQQNARYFHRGPLPRRMTAEQFMDSVWQLTGSAPRSFDAPVRRFPPLAKLRQVPEEYRGSPPKLSARWIRPAAAEAEKPEERADQQPPMPPAFTLEKTFAIKDTLPERAVAVVLLHTVIDLMPSERDDEPVTIIPEARCTVWLNGKDLGRTEAGGPTLFDLGPFLKAGDNVLRLAITNSGKAPEAVLCEAHLRFPQLKSTGGEVQGDITLFTPSTDDSWRWVPAVPDARGRFGPKPEDWQPVAVVEPPTNNSTAWQREQAAPVLATAVRQPAPMVRASLLKNTRFMAALGRPNRDQVVTMRPDGLTTLEAIELANGEELAQPIAAGARRMLAETGGDTSAIIQQLFRQALSREPTAAEESLAREMLTETPAAEQVADLIWSLLMLPEFQLIQ